MVPFKLLFRQFVAKELGCEAVLALGHFFWSSTGKKVTASVAAFGTEVDDVVGTLDDLKIVLDDDDGVAS